MSLDFERFFAWLGGTEDSELNEIAAAQMAIDGYDVTSYRRETNGFTAFVTTELGAHRLALAWRHSDHIEIRGEKNEDAETWIVRVYGARKTRYR